MTRLPELKETSLSAEARQVFDTIKKSRGVVRGPFAALLYVPELAERVANVGAYIRYEGLLSPPDRELAILSCGREIGARYEWFEHESVALDAGVSPAAIEALRAQSSLEHLATREQLIISIVQSLCRKRSLQDALYELAIDELGAKQLVELVTLVGYYNMLGLVILSFEISPPQHAAPTF